MDAMNADPQDKTQTPPELIPIFRSIRWRTIKLLGIVHYEPHLMVLYLDLHPYCFYCGIELSYATATIEHLEDKHNNRAKPDKAKVLACYPCNTRRGSADLATFLTSPYRFIVNPDTAGFHFYRYAPQKLVQLPGSANPGQATGYCQARRPMLRHAVIRRQTKKEMLPKQIGISKGSIYGLKVSSSRDCAKPVYNCLARPNGLCLNDFN